MKFFLAVLGLLFIVEGLPYFVFPERMKEIMAYIQEMPPQTLRIFGLISTIIGLTLCYIVQRTNIFS